MKENISYILHFGGMMLLVAEIGIICAIIASFLSSRVSADLGSILQSSVFRCVKGFSEIPDGTTLILNSDQGWQY